jgi:hypothetical protein
MDAYARSVPVDAAAGESRPGSFRAEIAGILLFSAALLLPALFNRFPLIFPDSGAYLSIALGHDYALDRSSFYGLFLAPFLKLVPGTAGLWFAIGGQALLVGSALWMAARTLVPRLFALRLMIPTLLLTAVGFHAAQFMPDAFTGPAVLLAWLAARRDPGENGAVLLWGAVTLAALMHYTHIPIVAASIGAALVAEKLLGLPWRQFGRRGVAGAVSVSVALLFHIGVNGVLLHQPRVAPMGPVFLYARLNEDGLIQPWLDRHCGHDAPADLCAIAPSLPHDSQVLLWGSRSPVARLVWFPSSEQARWRMVAAMDEANRGAILERPLAFAKNSLAAGARQFVTFAPLDDECPFACRNLGGGVAQVLERDRSQAMHALDSSRQVTDTMPKKLIRAVQIPIAAISLILLPFALAAAWRRRDRDMLTLAAAVVVALMVNAALAGALSDVHDRYQSRIVWLAPFLLFLLCARWHLLTGAFQRLGGHASSLFRREARQAPPA